ncbi:MAG: hypothetical protein DCO96_02345 [Fluviicola sp. XM-24bin1]|nr:MAG: hypothetical protein DCO96_02345 [Fluviicola sp. XM-24bin1]
MRLAIIFLFICLSSSAFSQETKEAYFQYHINARAMDTSIQKKQAAVLYNNNVQKIYFHGDSLRVDYSMGRDMLKTTVILDYKKGFGLMLSDGPMGKTAKHDYISNMNFNAITKDSTAVLVEFEESKTILGYECKKIMLKHNGVLSTHWVTQEIDMNMLPEGFTNPNIPGFPLESVEVADGLEITRRASAIKFEIDDPDTVFNLVNPPGYQYQFHGSDSAQPISD